VYSVKISDDSYKYKYKSMDAVDVVNLTYSQIKFIDVPEFILCVVICMQTSIIDIFYPKDEVPVLCSDMSHAQKCFFISIVYTNLSSKSLIIDGT
jgi:hypothetical protein